MKPLIAALSPNKPHIKSIMNTTKKSKPLTGAQKKNKKPSGAQKRKKKKEQEELVADIERLKLGPTDLWKLITDYPDIFETHVLKSGYLNESDIKMFYECCRASRDAVKRAKIELKEKFCVEELSSISTLELAWEGFPWGARVRYPDGKEYTLDQEDFCSQVACTNDLKLLRWVREEKQCDWDSRTSGMAAVQGNLDMLKYCVENGCKVDTASGMAAVQGNLDMLKYCCENGCEVDISTCALAAQNGHLDCLKYLRMKNCPWSERVCEIAHENNHMDILTYAVKNKCPGFEAYEQFIPKQ
jgi:hypothetical protein